MFKLSHVHILGTRHYIKALHESFKRRQIFLDFLCHCDYAKIVVSSFAHKIQSEYYDINRSVSIKGIEVEEFSETTHP